MRFLSMALLLCGLIGPVPTSALPCVVPDLPLAPVRQALARLSRPTQPFAAQIERWRALLPHRMSVGMRDGSLTGSSWTTSTSGALSERDMNLGSFGYSVRLDWDLRALWAPQPRMMPVSSHQRLQQAAEAEHLAGRIAPHLKQLRAAQSLAMQSEQGELLCLDAQAEAETALLVLQTLLDAAMP